MKILPLALAIAGALMVAGSVYMMVKPSHSHASPLSVLRTETYPSEVDVAWVSWKQTQGKAYGTSTDESYRKSVFFSHFKDIKAHNASNSSYRKALNKFSDLTVAEFKKQYLGLIASENKERLDTTPTNYNVPTALDWTTKGAVTPVKDQGQCGSCWAFSTTGSLEGLEVVNGGKLVSLSEQVLVDCAGSYGNYGCNGGLMDSAFKYVEANGLTTEANYPYEAVTDTCTYNKSESVFMNKSFRDVATGDNDKLVAALAQQPVSVAVSAEAFMSYQSGIFDDWTCSQGQVDHGVLAVGYGADNGNLFYKIKNSWGTSWGEQGYIRFARKTGKGVGMCNVTENASYPTM